MVSAVLPADPCWTAAGCEIWFHTHPNNYFAWWLHLLYCSSSWTAELSNLPFTCNELIFFVILYIHGEEYKMFVCLIGGLCRWRETHWRGQRNRQRRLEGLHAPINLVRNTQQISATVHVVDNLFSVAWPLIPAQFVSCFSTLNYSKDLPLAQGIKFGWGTRVHYASNTAVWLLNHQEVLGCTCKW